MRGWERLENMRVQFLGRYAVLATSHRAPLPPPHLPTPPSPHPSHPPPPVTARLRAHHQSPALLSRAQKAVCERRVDSSHKHIPR
jgi:hypothetical protein